MSTCTTTTCITTTITTAANRAATGRSRRSYWAHVGETFGLPLTGAQLDEAGALTDVAVVARYFPFLGDAERHEVLWALGAYLRTG